MKVFFFSSKTNKSFVAVIADTLVEAIDILNDKIVSDKDSNDYLVRGSVKCCSGEYIEVFAD